MMPVLGDSAYPDCSPGTAASVAAASRLHARAPAPRRLVAITIDDLPINSAYLRTEGQLEAIIYKLLAKIRRSGVPVTPFVNEGRLYVGPNTAQGRAEWIEAWAQMTRQLGNHTYSHSNLDQVGAAAFKEDIVKGETLTLELHERHAIRQKYFRHPYMNMGRTLEEKREVDAFLEGRGYRIAPVTIDTGDSYFSYAFDLAELDDDAESMARIGAAYLAHFQHVLDMAAALSHDIFQRPIAEILLLHATALNARYFKEVLQLLQNSGYDCIPLEQALNDPAYRIGDEAYAPSDSWRAQRMWAGVVAPHVPIPLPPDLPAFVEEACLDAPA